MRHLLLFLLKHESLCERRDDTLKDLGWYWQRNDEDLSIKTDQKTPNVRNIHLTNLINKSIKPINSNNAKCK